MKPNVILTVTSLLTTILFSIHVTDDIIRGMSEGGARENTIIVLIMLVYLYGILMLAERRLGQVIILLGGLAAATMPLLHARSASHGGHVAQSPGGFLFIWTVLALGVTGAFSAILAARELLSRQSKDGKMTAVAHESPDRRR